MGHESVENEEGAYKHYPAGRVYSMGALCLGWDQLPVQGSHQMKDPSWLSMVSWP